MNDVGMIGDGNEATKTRESGDDKWATAHTRVERPPVLVELVGKDQLVFLSIESSARFYRLGSIAVNHLGHIKAEARIMSRSTRSY